MTFGLTVAACVLAAVALVQDGGKNLVAWAVVLLAVGLLWPRL
jgi:hypothetical protein